MCVHVAGRALGVACGLLSSDRMRIHVAFSLALVAACSGGGGGDDGGGGADAAPSPKCMEAVAHSDLAWIQQNVFSASCTFMACHKGTATDADGLNLEPGMSRDMLVNQDSVQQPGMMRVMPGNAAQSYLLVAIGQTAGTLPEDGMMPLNSPQLCHEKRDAIERWIAAGAPE